MSCNSCQSKFSFFSRESGCPNCGFSYCNKCLKYKCRLSNDNVMKVCGPCYHKQMSNSRGMHNDVSLELSSNVTSNTPPSMAPVDIEYKINALDNPVKPPIVIYKQGHWEKVKTGLDPVDQIIVDRLRKLKDDDKQPSAPTINEICRRLALLRDENPDQASNTHINRADTKPDHDKTASLIQQYMETLELSSTNSSTENMEIRLNALKGIDPPESSTILDKDDDDDDDEALTNKIIEKAIAEVALEAKYDDKIFETMEQAAMVEYSDDDLTCVMCEQTDHLVQCTGCTGDLYCSICFEDNHDDLEMEKHKTIVYKDRKRAYY